MLDYCFPYVDGQVAAARVQRHFKDVSNFVCAAVWIRTKRFFVKYDPRSHFAAGAAASTLFLFGIIIALYAETIKKHQFEMVYIKWGPENFS